MMNGVRRPSLLVQRSDRMPKSGRRNRPKTLSSAMTAPVAALSRLNVSVSMSGTMPSNTCQKLIMPMKGSEAKATLTYRARLAASPPVC